MPSSDVNIYSSFDSYIIDSIFKDNYPFYALYLDENIEWKLVEDKDVNKIATVSSRKGNILSINIHSIMDASNYGDYKGIEYYILHEIRHIYQNIEIKNYKNKLPTSIDESMIKTWIEEKKKHLKRKDDKGNDNVEFYLQEKEVDAYAFAYAVMKYKYDDAFDPFIPAVYKRPFLVHVRRWLDVFKKEDI